MVELSELQDRIYSIFVEFDRICRKHGIHYSMEGGTLLGAVKYGNFVPWDDDIDVIMTRQEYDRFLAVAPGDLGERFFLQSYHNVSQFPLNYAKLCMQGTKICDYDYTHLTEMNHGIFMDIFPVDNVNPSFLRGQCALVGVLTGARKTKLKVKLGTKGVRRVVYGLLSLLPMSALSRAVTKACTLFNNRETACIYEVCNSNRKFKPLPRWLYQEFVELPFRDQTFMAVKDYDFFLKSRFGKDYVETLPPEEARKPSHNQNIVFEDN